MLLTLIMLLIHVAKNVNIVHGFNNPFSFLDITEMTRDISDTQFSFFLAHTIAMSLLIPGDSRPPIPVILGHPC